MLKKVFGERTYFRLFFIFYMFTNTLALGYFKITINPLSYIVFGWATILLLYELFTKQFSRKGYVLFILTYGLLLLIATVHNTQYSDKNSYIMAGMQILIFLLMFGNSHNTSLQTIKQELRKIIPFTSLLCGIASFISLLMYVTNFYRSQNGWYLGLVGGRLFGVYFNCNPASFLAIIVILLSVYALRNKYKHSKLYMIGIVIQLLYILLTQCRAAIVILSVIIVMAVYYKLFRAKAMSKFKQICISIFLCFSVLFSSQIIQETLAIIPKMQGAKMEDGSRFQFEKLYEIYHLLVNGNMDDIKEIILLINDVSSGRIELVHTGIQIWQHDPLRGVGAYNFRKMALDHPDLAGGVAGEQVLHTHNVFLETLVTAGIFGFIIFFIFFIKSILLIRDVFKKYQNKQSYFIILLFTMIVVSEFIGGMFDFGVFYNYSLSATLAWLFLGYLYWLNDHPDYELINTSKDYEFMKYELEKIDYHKEENFNIASLHSQILHKERVDNHYYLTISYASDLSSFVYVLDYEIMNKHLDDKQLEAYDTIFIKELYQMIKDDITNIISH